MLSHYTAQSPKGSFAKIIIQEGLCKVLRARFIRFKTVLEKFPYLAFKAPYRRSGQALTTLKQVILKNTTQI
ncbi:hypothetical protein LGVB_00815 (plasmid) [Lactobacillus gasseri]|uniref:Uncharacterized protein n=1 Tax=Enterococcus faecium TaxID=1352 RepID=A0A7D5KL76_ENTFC|nr:hypothetical protein [Enterococcus faecium]MBS7524870.1 hypothetical protein [Lactobacillus gasseri]EGP5255072.1 hypothetical protein [Enterococcus faecium]MBS7524959.1 hypothetical protein [Lactobacillus gasseri]PHL08837.1 hypothetical protein CQR41_14980 [Enterococcus faecium]PQE37415.1 hypothetical protein CUS20_06695 [Enterococcus faecium]